jgi:phosphatidylglycerophosphate synthase
MGTFKESLKNYESEELADLYIFRPLGHLVVKIVYHTNLTPNQISLLSVLSSLTAGILYAVGMKWSWIAAACFYFFYCVLDCVDGQIARLKGTGTKTGRIVDGIADYAAHFVLYIGLIVAMIRMKASFPLPFLPESNISGWIWILAAAFTVMSHAMLLDHHRNLFIAASRGKKDWEEDEIDIFSKEYDRLRKTGTGLFERAIIRCYLSYTKMFLFFQRKSSKDKNRKKKEKAVYELTDYYNRNKLSVRLWGLIGGSTNILIFSIMSAIFEMQAYLWFTVFASNIYAIGMLIYQQYINSRVAKN